MINLLPPERRKAIRFGRQNTVLVSWVVGLGIAIIGLLIILGGGWVYLNQQSKSLQADITTSQEQLKAENLTQVQQNADEISGDVKVINQVLSNEVRFSDLLTAIGQVMPVGTVLNSLTLTSVKGSLDLTASAKDYASAAQIGVNLSDPKNGLFSKADIISINCTSGDATYNCNASFKALFSSDAQKKFLGIAKASP